jgi:flagellar basal-body rod modification protein FlgD
MSTITSSTAIPIQEASNTPPPVGKATLDRADFMKLFITQLQHQDPLEPMNSYEMASQLAQFSSMEATMRVADNMEQLLNYQVSQNNLQLLSLVDKGVQGFGNKMGVVDGAATPTEFHLFDAADSCIIEIYDAAGRVVDRVDLGYAAVGLHQLSWDAKTPNGDTVEDGLYSYVVKAITGQGQQVEVEYRTSGRVTGIEFNSGKATVSVDKYVQMNVGDILKVN